MTEGGHNFEGLASDVPISTMNIEQALLSFAVPGIWGSVRIKIRPLRTAASEVMLLIEHRTVSRIDVAKAEQHVIASSERYNRVRSVLAEKADQFKLLCPVREIIGNFQDGKLSSLEIVNENQKLV